MCQYINVYMHIDLYKYTCKHTRTYAHRHTHRRTRTPKSAKCAPNSTLSSPIVPLSLACTYKHKQTHTPGHPLTYASSRKRLYTSNVSSLYHTAPRGPALHPNERRWQKPFAFVECILTAILCNTLQHMHSQTQAAEAFCIR